MSLIVETIVLQDTKLEEIERFYISDALSEKEKAIYIIKKGYPGQRLHFISNLVIYYQIDKEFLCDILPSIVENIVIWDSTTHKAFPKSLKEIVCAIMKGKGCRKALSVKDSQMIEIIMLHYVKAITTMEQTVSDAYMAQFNDCIDFLSAEHYRIKPSKELVEYVFQLGKYDQAPSNMRYCLYFTTSWIRVSSESAEELLGVFYSLCFETQKEIKYEIAHDLRYIIRETDLGSIKSKLYPTMKTYLGTNDFILKEIVLESLLDNLGICDISMQSEINSSLEEILLCDDAFVLANDFSHLSKIFTLVVKCYHKSLIENIPIAKIDCQGFIIQFLRKFLLSNESINNLERTSSSDDSYRLDKDDHITYPIEYLFDIFDLIGECLMNSNKAFYHSCFLSLLNLLTSRNEVLFFSNIKHIIAHIGKDILTAPRLLSIFNFLKKDDETAINLTESNNSNSSIGFYDGFNYSTFGEVMRIMKSKDNEVFFFKLFGSMNHLEKVCDSLNENWRSQLSIFAAFTEDVLFYFVRNYQKYYHINWVKKLIIICKKYISLENANNVLLSEVTKLMARLLKYSSDRGEIRKVIDEEVFLSGSFFKRRLGIVFVRECHRIMSYQLFEQMKIGEKIAMMVDDNVALLRIAVIQFVKDNDFCGSWVASFFQKVEEISQCDIIQDEDLIKACRAFMQEKNSFPNEILNRERNKIRLEEEKLIREIELVLEELKSKEDRPKVFTKKPNTFIKMSQNPNFIPIPNRKRISQIIKKTSRIKAISNHSLNNSLVAKKAATSSLSLTAITVPESKIFKLPPIGRNSRKLLPHL